MKTTTIPARRATDHDGEINVVQSVNAPIGLFRFYKDLALAQFGDSTKKQFHFRRALTEYIENHKDEFDKTISSWRKRAA